MKLKAKIFSTLNLIFFISSFSLMVMDSLAGQGNSGFFSKHKLYTPKKTGTVDEANQQVSENDETENDSDSDFEIQHFLAPFLVSLSEVLVFSLKFFYTSSFAVPTVDRLYIALRNFRI